MFRLGLIINPFAGIGGRVGLKGSDGKAVREKALELGALKLAESKAKNCLTQLMAKKDEITIYTVSGEMGENLCSDIGFKHLISYKAQKASTEIDTKESFLKLQKEDLDLILFVGGDGTARNIFQSYQGEQAVLGVPAGVKIHSGVFAISAEAAGLLVLQLINGKMLSLISADVVDIDETAFRQGQLKARKYGDLQIPSSLDYVQAVKHGNQEVESLVVDDIAAEIIESMQDDTYYVIGSGTTCAGIMQQLNLDNTLLGSDIVFREELLESDVTEKDLLRLLKEKQKVKFIITIIGGQGHILGRGNHQLSPSVIKKAQWKNFIIIATKSKIEQLDQRPLRVDTGNLELDHQLYGLTKVIVGYRDYVLYAVGAL